MNLPDVSRYDDVRVFWDALARRYDDHFDADSGHGYALRSRLAVTLSLAGGGPGEALDAGMGPGRLCEALAQRGWTVSGVDASPEMAALARRRVPAAAERLLTAPLQSLPFADGSFDLVTATGALEYSGVEVGLAELARVLRPGGIAVVSFPNPRCLYARWKTRVWYPVVDRSRARRTNPEPLKGAPARDTRSFVAALRDAGLRHERLELSSYLVLISPLDEILPAAAGRAGAWAERTLPRAATALGTQAVYRSVKV